MSGSKLNVSFDKKCCKMFWKYCDENKAERIFYSVMVKIYEIVKGGGKGGGRGAA